MTRTEVDLLKRAVRAFMRDETPDEPDGWSEGMDLLQRLLRMSKRTDAARIRAAREILGKGD